jgi:3-phenylpropionate/trans-cinnamate dioxygenase ferredoxin reductase subunit
LPQWKTDRPDLRRICVVGASLAGLHAVRSLRRNGYPHEIVLVGAERHLPYDRPPLSKQIISGEWGAERIALLDQDGARDLGLDVRLGVAAAGLDVAASTVHLADGRALAYDGLVIATGTTPRTLPGVPDVEGVITLRTIEDGLRLAAAAVDGSRVVVIGAGFIGLEVAAACRKRGAAVSVVEAAGTVFGGRYGSTLSDACVALHRDNGVDLHFGALVDTVEYRHNRVTAVRLRDGRVLPADVVVVGIGVRPAVDWLAGSGLDIGDGVLCDPACFAGPNIVAAGDVARWHDEGIGPVRIEHWTNAAEQGKFVAENLLSGRAGARPYVCTPYFWSDQYQRRIQFAGVLPQAGRQLTVGESDRFLTIYGRGDRLEAVLGFASPGPFMRLRRMLVDGATFADAAEVVAA